MATTQHFDMNAWGLQSAPHIQQQWLQSAFMHDLDGLIFYHHPDQFVSTSVNPVHVFACGYPRKGGLYASRQVLQWLIDHGQGDVNAIDLHGWLPINYAVWFGHAPTTDVLLELGSPVQNSGGTQPLDTALEAIAQRRCDTSETCARLLLMHGADPNKSRTLDPNFGGVTWLVWALSNERWDWAECLWNYGARSLRDKEKHLLILRGSEKSLAWAEYKGFDMLPLLSSSHEHFEALLRVRALVDEEKLLLAMGDVLTRDDDDDGRGRRKM